MTTIDLSFIDPPERKLLLADALNQLPEEQQKQIHTMADDLVAAVKAKHPSRKTFFSHDNALELLAALGIFISKKEKQYEQQSNRSRLSGCTGNAKQ